VEGYIAANKCLFRLKKQTQEHTGASSGSGSNRIVRISPWSFLHCCDRVVNGQLLQLILLFRCHRSDVQNLCRSQIAVDLLIVRLFDPLVLQSPAHTTAQFSQSRRCFADENCIKFIV